MKSIKIIFSTILATSLFLSSCEKPPVKTNKTNEPVQLSQKSTDASCVFLSDTQEGQPLVSWVEVDANKQKHLYFASFDSENQIFSKPKEIPVTQNMAVHEEGMPKLTAKGDGSLLAIYETSTPKPDNHFGVGSIMYLQSFDQGKTWTQPEPVNPLRQGELSYNFSNMMRLGDGEIGIAYLGTNSDKENGRPILFAKTSPGKGFQPSTTISTHGCECCRTAVTGDKEGNVMVVYRDLLPDSIRDISASISHDFGKTFKSPKDFSNDQWKIDGCPHNGPSIAMNSGKAFVTWFTGGDKKGVYFAELDKTGNTTQKRQLNSEAKFVQLALTASGTPIAAYDVRYGDGDSGYSKILVSVLDGKHEEMEISPKHARANHPVIKTFKNNQAIVAYSDDGKVFYKVLNLGNSAQNITRNSSVKHSAQLASLNK